MMARLKIAILKAFGMAGRLATDAIVWHVVLGLAGIGAIVVGVESLFGPGWALISGGIGLIASSAYIKRGLNA
jgi:hypothetical protein